MDNVGPLKDKFLCQELPLRDICFVGNYFSVTGNFQKLNSGSGSIVCEYICRFKNNWFCELIKSNISTINGEDIRHSS